VGTVGSSRSLGGFPELEPCAHWPEERRALTQQTPCERLRLWLVDLDVASRERLHAGVISRCSGEIWYVSDDPGSPRSGRRCGSRPSPDPSIVAVPKDASQLPSAEHTTACTRIEWTFNDHSQGHGLVSLDPRAACPWRCRRRWPCQPSAVVIRPPLRDLAAAPLTADPGLCGGGARFGAIWSRCCGCAEAAIVSSRQRRRVAELADRLHR